VSRERALHFQGLLYLGGSQSASLTLARSQVTPFLEIASYEDFFFFRSSSVDLANSSKYDSFGGDCPRSFGVPSSEISLFVATSPKLVIV